MRGVRPAVPHHRRGRHDPVHGDARRPLPRGAVRRHRRDGPGLERARPERVPRPPDGTWRHGVGGARARRARSTTHDVQSPRTTSLPPRSPSPRRSRTHRAACRRRCPTLLGCTVVLKFENFQFTASFKERGACNKLLHLTDDERTRGVITVSAGNHAQAVARHAASARHRRARSSCRETTPFVKVAQHPGPRRDRRAVRRDGRRGVRAMAQQLAAEQGRTFVHPFDDAARHRRPGNRSASSCSPITPISTRSSCPVGGGGLLAGLSVVYGDKAPDVELVGVQSESYPVDGARARRRHAPVPGRPDDGRGHRRVEGRRAHVGAPARRAASTCVTVSERAIEEAVNLLPRDREGRGRRRRRRGARRHRRAPRALPRASGSA